MSLAWQKPFSTTKRIVIQRGGRLTTTTDATRSIMALLLGPALLGSSLLLASPNGLGRLPPLGWCAQSAQ
jgi:hypothetical protein